MKVKCPFVQKSFFEPHSLDPPISFLVCTFFHILSVCTNMCTH